MDEKNLLSIAEVCQILQISRPTLNKLRRERRLAEFYEGLRVRFHREEVLKLVGNLRNLPPLETKRIRLTVFGTATPFDLETGKNTFDLKRIESIDPFGVLSLFCAVADRANQGNKVRLEVEDNFVCNHLRTLGFFIELEKLHKDRVSWDKGALKSSYEDVSYPIPLTEIRLQKQEAPVVERLIKLLREQGFSENIGPYIGWFIGELVDNSMTHLVRAGFPASCWVLAQRFRFVQSKSDCLIIGVADLGPGIHATLKTNPEYSALSDDRAFLTAFKPRVTSWLDVDRGKGLTDILGIAMGNESVFRAESSQFCFRADFRDKTHGLTQLPNGPTGTRFALVLIDHDFSMKKRTEIDEYINTILGEL